MSRDRIDEVRRFLVDAFMAEDMPAYSQAVLELERLIGIEPGDRNPRGVMTPAKLEHIKGVSARTRKFKWGDRSLEAELHDDGGLTYSIKYEDEP